MCQKFSVKYLQLANALVIIAGLACLGFGGYVWYTLGTLAAGYSEYTVAGPIAAGLVLLLAGTIGCCGVNKKSKCLLFIYLVLVFLMVVLTAATGFVILTYADILPPTGVESYLDDFESTVYNKCCVDAGFANDPVPACPATPRCISQDFPVTTEVCDFLENLKLPVGGINVPVVGNTTLGGCGGPSGQTAFFTLLTEFITTNLLVIGIAEIALFVVLLLTFTSSCALFCSNKDSLGNPNAQTQQGEVSARKLV